ncbi:MAG TPA: putative glycolipid-binding domain-containing protein [Methylomirabilota bacterium]|nr:putative glycolipid-binding domain-containing protein [Methylomirabilota bacterium]
MTDFTVLWRRLDQPGHESARLFGDETGWHLAGSAVFAGEGRACRLDYRIACDRGWRTVSGRVTGWVGRRPVELEVAVDAAGRWRLDGRECPAVAGCVDLDLNFSPSTNLLPIRRLALAAGQEADVRAAWLRFPSFALEPLEQRYRRIDEHTYRYESAGGRFVRDLTVNAAGFVTAYPDFWRLEAGPDGA